MRTPRAAGISQPMQEKPNSRWHSAPPVVSQSFSRLPTGPPAAATTESPSCASALKAWISSPSPIAWPGSGAKASAALTSSHSAWSFAISAFRWVRSTPHSRQAAARAVSASRASPTTGSAPFLKASWALTLMLTNVTSGLWNRLLEAVAKSPRRVPTAITRSACSAERAAAVVPSTP